MDAELCATVATIPDVRTHCSSGSVNRDCSLHWRFTAVPLLISAIEQYKRYFADFGCFHDSAWRIAWHLHIPQDTTVRLIQ